VCITNLTALVNQAHRRRTGEKETLDLKILAGDLRALVGQDQVRRSKFGDMPLDHFWPIGHHYQDFSVQILELSIVMAQLRHMVGAMPSDKTDIEYQQDILRAVNIG
jgi:hypothetical protein